MENIISEATILGGPGGGTHAHYLALDSTGDGFELSAVQQEWEFDGTHIMLNEVPLDDYSIYDPDGELGEGANVDGVEVGSIDEDGVLIGAGYCSSHYPENFDDVPDDIEFTDPTDPCLADMLNYFNMSAEELRKECELLGKGEKSDQSERRPLGLVGSTRRRDMAAITGHLAADVKPRRIELDTALFLAAWQNDTRIVKLLTNAGADVNAVLWNESAGMEATVLMVAAESGLTKTAGLLLDHGADVNVKGYGGNSPLHRAVLMGHPETVDLLLDHGADVDSTDDEGKSPLHHATICGHEEIVSLFINVEDSDGWTPLHKAVWKGDADMVSLLIEAGADVNVEDSRGCTPLYLAARSSDAEMDKLLKEAGAKESI